MATTLRDILDTIAIKAETPHGQGTDTAEYIESKTPRDCGHCHYMNKKNLCNQKQMLLDNEVKTDKASGLKIVDPVLGCCRFWKAE